MTPELEKLILSGQAEYRNQACLSSAAFTVTCPEGKTIVLTDIDFTHGRAFFSIVTFPLIFLKFYGVDQKRQNVISFYAPMADSGTGVQGDQYRKEIYFVYTSDCRIDVSCLLVDAFPVVDNSLMPAVSKDLPEPGGYGTTLPVTRAIALSGVADFYLPQGLKDSGFPPTAGMKNDPYPGIVAGVSALPNIQTVSEGFCMNIGYVVINKPILPKL